MEHVSHTYRSFVADWRRQTTITNWHERHLTLINVPIFIHFTLLRNIWLSIVLDICNDVPFII